METLPIRIGLAIDEDTLGELDTLCLRDGRGRSDYLRRLIRRHIAETKQLEPQPA